VKDVDARSFYEIEAARGQWSLKEVRRQFDSALYERLALSRDKDGVRALAEGGQIVSRPKDALKDPYVLEVRRCLARAADAPKRIRTGRWC
jgi:predicted nuclease of restriction endonuclease-like (RecB) superfamily